jgi:hypothetical protein
MSITGRIRLLLVVVVGCTIPIQVRVIKYILAGVSTQDENHGVVGDEHENVSGGNGVVTSCGKGVFYTVQGLASGKRGKHETNSSCFFLYDLNIYIFFSGARVVHDVTYPRQG